MLVLLLSSLCSHTCRRWSDTSYLKPRQPSTNFLICGDFRKWRQMNDVIVTKSQRGGEVRREWNGEGALGVGGLSLHFLPRGPPSSKLRHCSLTDTVGRCWVSVKEKEVTSPEDGGWRLKQVAEDNVINLSYGTRHKEEKAHYLQQGFIFDLVCFC